MWRDLAQREFDEEEERKRKEKEEENKDDFRMIKKSGKSGSKGGGKKGKAKKDALGIKNKQDSTKKR